MSQSRPTLLDRIADLEAELAAEVADCDRFAKAMWRWKLLAIGERKRRKRVVANAMIILRKLRRVEAEATAILGELDRVRRRMASGRDFRRRN